MRFVKLADDPAQLLQWGPFVIWMRDGEMKGDYVAAFRLDPTAEIVSRDELVLCWLVGDMPNGVGVTLDRASFAGRLA